MSVWNLGAGKKVTVSSVVYNLAGDEKDRVQFLKATMLSKIMSTNRTSMGEHLVGSYLRGPGIKLRNFSKWAVKSGYNDNMGLGPGDLNVGSSVDFDVLAQEIPHDPDRTVSVRMASIGPADYVQWADQYIYENHPERIQEEYVTDFDLATNTISFVFSDDSTDSFQPVGFVPTDRYLYATFQDSKQGYSGPLVPGTRVVLSAGVPFPPTSGWTEISNVTSSEVMYLKQVVVTDITYSDDTPSETNTVETTVDSVSFQQTKKVFEITDFMGTHPTEDALYSLRQIMTQVTGGIAAVGNPVVVTDSVDIGGGVIRTTVTTTTVETFQAARYYQIDTQDLFHVQWGAMGVFIYQYNTGNAVLDAMFVPTDDVGTFFPFIPIRIDNNFVAENWYGQQYPLAKRALRKSVNGKFDRIVDDLKDNPSLKDIDYVYAVFGVPLNTKENDSLRYIYELFHQILLGSGSGSSSNFAAWQVAYNEAHASVETWNTWKLAQASSSDPLFGTPEPSVLPYPEPPTQSLRVTSQGLPGLNYNMTVNWNSITESTGSGLKKPDAKRGDLWIDKGGTSTFDASMVSRGSLVPLTAFSVDHISINWQVDEDTWRTLEISGLQHVNKIYGSKSVTISAHQALDDQEDSGFIIPLQSEIYRSVPLVHGTQMSTACCYLVMNCVTIVRERWYQTIVFKILIVIIAIVVTIWAGGVGGAAAGGLLGTNAAVGAAVGFTGTAALIAGAVANAIAAIIVTQIITYASTAIFGDKIGIIVGMIASVIALQVGTVLASGASLATSFNSLMDVQSLMRLTSAAGEGYSRYMQAETREMAQSYEKVMKEYERQYEELQGKYEKDFGNDGTIIDPLTLTDITATNPSETRDSFLSRTLMTGSEIAGLSLDMIGVFSDLTLNTELPIG